MLGIFAFLPLLAQASSLAPRAVIDHDQVEGLPETVPNGIKGDVYKAYQPYLKVFEGCVPFPAVDAEGNTGYLTSPFNLPPNCHKYTNILRTTAVASRPLAPPTATAAVALARSMCAAASPTQPTPTLTP